MLIGQCCNCKRDIKLHLSEDNKEFYICEGCNNFLYLNIDKYEQTFKTTLWSEYIEEISKRKKPERKNDALYLKEKEIEFNNKLRAKILGINLK